MTSHRYSLRDRSTAIVTERLGITVSFPGPKDAGISSVAGAQGAGKKSSLPKISPKRDHVRREIPIRNKKIQLRTSEISHSEGVCPNEVLDIEDVKPLVYTFAEHDAANIKSCLLSWYDKHHRVLPWRQNLNSLHQKSGDRPETLSSKESVRIAKEQLVGQDYCSDEVARASDSLERKSKIHGKSGRSRSEEGIVAANEVSCDLEMVGKETSLAPSTQDQRGYEVWVSEMMLQQTRVATVIEYYKRWMERWPTVHHLAQASQEEVNAVWAGLGYYRRARFLLEGAKQIVGQWSGLFPRQLKDLQGVSGIGNYTCGAIASIAFQEPVPVVDGNVVRVLCRLRAIPDNPKSSRTVKTLWALAGELVDADRPGDLNQAIMELGATVCTRTSPSCSSCPISTHCKALALQEDSDSEKVKSVTEFPVTVAKAVRRKEFVAVCVLELACNAHVKKINRDDVAVQRNSFILLVQRPKQGLLAGLWEFPSVSLGKAAPSKQEQRMAMDQYLKDCLSFNLDKEGDLVVMKRQAVGNYTHLFSHIRMHFSIEWLLLCPKEGSKWKRSNIEDQATAPVKWVEFKDFLDLGLSSGVKKIHSMYYDHLKAQSDPHKPKKSRTGANLSSQKLSVD